MTETLPEPLRLDGSAPAPRWRRLLRGLVLLPIVVAVVRAVATGWFPIGDSALLAVRAYDVGTSHHPLLGSWTSASLAIGVNVNNPGPLYPDLLAPFMWTIGRVAGIGPATAIGVGAVNAVFALGTLLIGDRIGGWRVERWCMLLVAALTWSMGSELLIDIWQPHALLLPFACLLVLTVGVTTGHLRLLPWWLAVASIVLQTHVAYVYAIAVLGVAVIVALIVGVARRVRVIAGERGRGFAEAIAVLARHRTALTALAVVAVAWTQPLIEQVGGRGEGNLHRLAANAGGGDLTVGAGAATKMVAAIVALPPWWTRFGYEDSVPSTPLTEGPNGAQLVIAGLPGAAVAVAALAIVLGVLGTLVVMLRGEEQRPARQAVVVSLLGLAVAIGGLTIQTVTLTGLGNHQVRWVFGLAVFVHVSIAWGVAELVRSRRPRLPALDGPLAATVTVFVLWNLPFHAHDLGPTADRAAQATLERTFDDLATFDPGGPVVYDTDNVRVFEPNSAAVMMHLRELGVDFRFDGEIDVRQYGEARRADGGEVGRLRQFERMDALLYAGEACTLSLQSGVDSDEQAAADQLIDAAATDLASGNVSVDVAGLPDDLTELVTAAVAGDVNAARRIVGEGLLPVLVREGRVEPTPALTAASTSTSMIVARVNSTLRVVAAPATLC